MPAYTAQTWTDGVGGGTPLSAARLNTLETGVAALGVWTTWVPTATAGLVVNNGVFSGRYSLIGKTCNWWMSYTVGSTDTFSGVFTFSLPVATSASWTTPSPIGVSYFQDSSAGSSSRISGTAFKAASAAFFLLVNNLASSSNVNTTTPWTWATGDTIYISGSYETT